MNEIKKIWTDKYTVNWYDADTSNSASLVSLGNFLQVSAFRHAQHLGFDYTGNGGFEGIWVLVRMLIKIDKYPKWQDEVTVKTWHRGADGFVAMRDFEILDSENNRIGAVTSHWFVLDPQTRKAVPPEISDKTVQTAGSGKAMEENPERIIIREDIPHIYTVTVRYTDLDMYGHVNNTRYIDWVINSFPADMHKDYRISSLMIEFLSESRLGEEINIYAKIDQNAVVKGIREGDEKTIFRARVSWIKR